jgi:hypothetical protein
MTIPSLLQIYLLSLQRVAEIYTQSATDPQGRIVGARLEEIHDRLKSHFTRICTSEGGREIGPLYIAELYGLSRQGVLCDLFRESQSLSRNGGSPVQLAALKKVIHLFMKTWPRDAFEVAHQDAQSL